MFQKHGLFLRHAPFVGVIIEVDHDEGITARGGFSWCLNDGSLIEGGCIRIDSVNDIPLLQILHLSAENDLFFWQLKN